jgi:hypothetical protein
MKRNSVTGTNKDIDKELCEFFVEAGYFVIA